MHPHIISHYSRNIYTRLLCRIKVSNLSDRTSKHAAVITDTFTRLSRSGICELPRTYCYFSNSINRHHSLKTPLLADVYALLKLNNLQIFCSSRSICSDTSYKNPNSTAASENQQQTKLHQDSTASNQCCTADELSLSQQTMTDREHPRPSGRHVKYPSAAYRGVAVSDDDVQLMNDAREIFDQAVDSVLPHNLVRNILKLSQNDTILTVDNVTYLLKQNVYVIGFGKAVIGMARAVEDCIGQHIVKGVISVPTGIRQTFQDEGKQDMLLEPDSRIVVMEGAAGNLPDVASHKAAMEIMKIAEEVKEDDILIVLISGGGSALLPSPKPPITLEDMLSLTRLMSKSGSSIIQLNTVRKEIEMLKGGGLAKLAQSAKVLALILSDVIGDPLDFIAGGPTVKDTSASEDSLRVLKELYITEAIPPSVRKVLNEEHNRNADQELDTLDWSLVQNVLVGSNKSACEVACARSVALGYLPYLLSTQVEGEAQDIGRMYISLAKYISLGLQGYEQNKEASDLENLLLSKFNIDHNKLKQLQELAQKAVTSGKKGVCIVAGGETTVIVKGKGIGGRNQEMAVAAAIELGESDHRLRSSLKVNDGRRSSTQTKVTFLAAGTDGIDGPNIAAGGVITAGFMAETATSGLDAKEFLNRNDTYTLLSKVDHGLNHVITGHTGTNVMDIHLVLITNMQ
uniref:Glycerate kinase n=1 Tax=Arion vulgaris TaxID=1028688 RepID=A0A0B6ZWQ3_9EUPU